MISPGSEVIDVPKQYLGVDLGGTNIKVAVIDGDGRLLRTLHGPTPSRDGPGAVVAAMAELGRRSAEGGDLSGVGVACPGVIDMAAGRVKFLPNIPGDWLDRPIAAELHEALGAPTVLLNDARAATYGELHFGAGRGKQDFAMIAVGTGIGGGVVIDGKLHLGHNGHAGEVGHTALDLHGPRCACGGWGCAESYSSASALANAARTALQSERPSTLRELSGGDPHRVTAHLVAQAAAAGDALATELFDRESYRLGVLCSNLALLFNPERLIVGGGLALAGEPLIAGIRRTMEDRIGWYLRYAPLDIVLAELGDEAGAQGVAAWARDRLDGETR